MGEAFSGEDEFVCLELHCCLGCTYSCSVSGLTNYCIAVIWYYLAVFWVDSLLWYMLAEVMVWWRFCDVILMAINHQSKFKSEIHRIVLSD